MTVPSTKRFAIRRRLGEGGMGVVYEAFDQERRAAVALKTLNRFDGAALTRFKREFRALQGLSHPNLVALDELFFENELWFFTMELLDGVDFVRHVTGKAPLYGYGTTLSAGASISDWPSAITSGTRATALTYDEGKLREALRQLLRGLSVLHQGDRVHRDVKPSNVLVTRDGRVVLLDFGLVTEASTQDRTTGRIVVGTPAYMAPEQASSGGIGPPADLYAVGVMLYEVLTGRLPFDGPPLQVLLDKQTKEPDHPSSIAEDIPPYLSDLCMKLLRFEPASRPTAADVMTLLEAEPAARVLVTRPSTEASVFVGRTRELDALRAAFQSAHRGELTTVLVCGESGVGKSYLVRRFVDEIVGQYPEAVVLQGRCYERESVPYKALDGVVDAVSRHLARVPASEAAAVLPVRPATLGQVFPAMLRVPQVAREHAALTTVAEPHELRRRAFAGLRELFARLRDGHDTVLVIDDLQWADDDGLRALAEILRPPEAPGLLLLGTVRVAPEKDEALRRVQTALFGQPRVVLLDNLGEDDARELAAAVLRRNESIEADPQRIAREAHGHPLFVEELARHVSFGGSSRAEVKLDDAIWSRILQLETATRELAELVCVAGKPIPQEIAAAAARVEPAEFNRRVAALRVSNLVRTGGARWADAIEPYHDRVREAVLARLPAELRRTLHEALAVAFEASSHRDAETLATHWREAGNVARAARYAREAGDQAAKAFAFDRAAEWYELALSLTPYADPTRRDLEIRLGDALADAGRGAMAASHFEAAAVQSTPLQALDLRRRAAEQLLRSGHFDRGIEATRYVLSAIGMRLPRTPFGTFALLVAYRVLLALRGVRFRAREPGQITAEEIARFDACMSVGMTLSFVDSFVGFAFMTRALLLALRYGDLERVIRAYSMLIPPAASPGSAAARKADAGIRYARELESKSGSAPSQVFVTGCSGAALYLSGRFSEGAKLLRESVDVARDRAPEMVFERVTLRLFLAQTLEFLGRLAELRELAREMIRDALSRGDIYALVIARTGAPNLGWLVDDHPDEADENATDALRAWSSHGFHLEHVFAFLARIRTRIYVGDGRAAHALASDCQRRVAGSLLHRIQVIRARARYLRGGAALLALAGGAPDRESLLADATADASALARERGTWTAPFAAVLRAGIALHTGSRDVAVSTLEEASRAFAADDMLAYAAAASHQASTLRGDEAGRDRAAVYFREEGAVAPERMIATLVPVLGAR